MKLSVGQLLQVYLTQNNMTQADLANKVGCSRGFISRMIHNHKKPGVGLAMRIAKNLTKNLIEQEGLRFFLLGCHREYIRFLKEYPHAFEDFRTTRDRKDDKGLRIY